MAPQAGQQNTSTTSTSPVSSGQAATDGSPTTGRSSSISSSSTPGTTAQPTTTETSTAPPQTNPPTSTTTPSQFSLTDTSSTKPTPTHSSNGTTGPVVSATDTNPSPGGLSSGGVAGVAIACIIIGLLLGFAGAFWFLRRRKRNAGPEYITMQTTPGNGNGEKMLPIPPPTGPAAGDAMQLNQFLLEPKPDSELVGGLRDIGHLLPQHVENNYHLAAVQVNPAALTQSLATLGIAQPVAARAAQLAADPRTRSAALQHVIAMGVLGSVVVNSTASVSLLPGSIASFARDMAPVERHRGNPQAFGIAFTRWRQLSAYLLNPQRSDRGALKPLEPGTTQQAHELVQALNGFLGYFVGGDRQQQEKNLHGVIMECARYGYLLFSQPGEFRLNFEATHDPNSIVVCPGLDKASDGDGNRYKPPQSLLAPITESV